jgi:ligand-binding sensor domain-containing protein
MGDERKQTTMARLATFAICLAHVISLRAEQLPTRVYTVADGLPANGINAVRQDSRGFIWFGTTDGITRFDGYQFRNFGIDEGLPVGANDLLEAPNGEFWVATRRGLYHFIPSPSGKSSPFVHYGPDFRANVLATDGKGGLWCGTSQGLYHVLRSSSSTDSWVIRPEDIGMPTQQHGSLVDGLLYTHGGVLWIASLSGLYRRFRRCADYSA